MREEQRQALSCTLKCPIAGVADKAASQERNLTRSRSRSRSCLALSDPQISRLPFCCVFCLSSFLAPYRALVGAEFSCPLLLLATLRKILLDSSLENELRMTVTRYFRTDNVYAHVGRGSCAELGYGDFIMGIHISNLGLAEAACARFGFGDMFHKIRA